MISSIYNEADLLRERGNLEGSLAALARVDAMLPNPNDFTFVD